MSASRFALLLVVISTFITASGQYFYKLGADRLPDHLLDLSYLVPNLLSLLQNWPLMVGLVAYAAAAAIFIIALRSGDLSTLYPLISLGFVWVTLVAVLILGEPLTVPKVAGIGCILLGVSFIGWGSK